MVSGETVQEHLDQNLIMAVCIELLLKLYTVLSKKDPTRQESISLSKCST